MTSTSYHHGNLREALIEAAVESVREHGHEALALRELARQIGVSHNAAYRHFAHRDDLVAEVASRAMRGLVEAMQNRLSLVRTREPVLRARRRLAAIGRAYVEFAVTEPGLFRVAFSAQAAPTSVGPHEQQDPYALLGQALDDLVEVGFLSSEARVGAEITCWSAMHGFSTLIVDGPLGKSPTTDHHADLDKVLVAIDRSYAATTGTTVTARELLARRIG